MNLLKNGADHSRIRSDRRYSFVKYRPNAIFREHINLVLFLSVKQGLNIRQVPEACLKLDERLRPLSTEIVTPTLVAEASVIVKIPTRVVSFMVTIVVAKN